MRRDKALLQWRGETFLSSAIRALGMATELVIVVSGKNVEEIRPLSDAAGAFTVTNPEPERGQFSSLQVGLREVLNRGRDAAMITLVDRPAPAVATVMQLRAAFEDAILREKWAVIPEFDGNHGHPIVVGREMIEAFLTAPPGSTARDVEHSNQQRIEYVRVADPLVLANLNTPEEYSQLTTGTSKR
jgi:molybdenum cofactor cytidylyltransferase